MSSLSTNLKTLMGLAKINASELARRTGVAQPIIHRLSTGQNINPKLATVKPLSEYFMVSVSQLIGEEALPIDCGAFAISGQSHVTNHVPLITWEKVRRADLSVQEQEVATFTDAHISKRTVAVQIETKQLEPWFPLGAIVILDPERRPKHLDFGLVRALEGEASLFKLVRQDNEFYALAPQDPPYQHNLKRLHPNQIIAVVVQTKLNF